MSKCTVPPPGWRCTRAAGHSGPCAAMSIADGDQIAQGLYVCGDGVAFVDGSDAESAAMAAYAVLRSSGLIGAGDWRVPERIGRTLQGMINGRAARAGAA